MESYFIQPSTIVHAVRFSSPHQRKEGVLFSYITSRGPKCNFIISVKSGGAGGGGCLVCKNR